MIWTFKVETLIPFGLLCFAKIPRYQIGSYQLVGLERGDTVSLYAN